MVTTRREMLGGHLKMNIEYSVVLILDDDLVTLAVQDYDIDARVKFVTGDTCLYRQLKGNSVNGDQMGCAVLLGAEAQGVSFYPHAVWHC